VHGIELLGCRGHGRLDRGDLAHPTLLSGFNEPVGEIGVNLLQPWQLGWIYPK
jgi:hypothetical protein